MANKKISVTFDSIMRDLKAHKYYPIYFLVGSKSGQVDMTEPYYIDKISDYIADNVLQPEERDFNQDVVFGLDVNAKDVVDLAKGYPIMAQKRVVIVKEAQNMRSLDPIEKYLDHIIDSTILVICYKSGSLKGKKILAKAEALGVVLECKKKRDYELPAFIENYVISKGGSIDAKAGAMIADNVGSDLNRLSSELDKLFITLPAENKHITPEIVEQQIGVSKDYNLYELTNAVIRKDVVKANQIVYYFSKNPDAGSVYNILPSLFRFFQNLMIAYYAPDRTNRNALANLLGLRFASMAEDYIQAMHNYSGRKTMNIISKIREIDEKSKGIDCGNTSKSDLLKELIFYIMH
jgi:DNA polymerase-3 subunit delta